MYAQSITSGTDYIHLEKSIAILKTLELAQKLKTEGVDINIICKTTGLSIDEINNL